MVEVTGDIWDYYDDGFPIVITTNGNLDSKKNAVMGKGIALQAKKKFPKLPMILGNNIQYNGNRVFYFRDLNLFTFPTKHNWWEKSDIDLIVDSALYLSNGTFNNRIPVVCMVRPGCSNGQLQWDQVKPYLEKNLPNGFTKFIIVNK